MSAAARLTAAATAGAAGVTGAATACQAGRARIVQWGLSLRAWRIQTAVESVTVIAEIFTVSALPVGLVFIA